MSYEAVDAVMILTMTSELAQRQIFMGFGLDSVVWRSERCPSVCPLSSALWYMEMKMMMTKVSLFLSIWRTSWPHSTTSTFKYNESTQTQLLRILEYQLFSEVTISNRNDHMWIRNLLIFFNFNYCETMFSEEDARKGSLMTNLHSWRFVWLNEPGG